MKNGRWLLSWTQLLSSCDTSYSTSRVPSGSLGSVFRRVGACFYSRSVGPDPVPWVRVEGPDTSSDGVVFVKVQTFVDTLDSAPVTFSRRHSSSVSSGLPL